jgi:hypothetical protein
MSQVKEEVIRMIEALPDESTINDILYHVYVRKTIEERLEGLATEEVFTQKEVERRAAEWFKSIGQSALKHALDKQSLSA